MIRTVAEMLPKTPFRSNLYLKVDIVVRLIEIFPLYNYHTFPNRLAQNLLPIEEEELDERKVH